jgi:VWFA-related protein
LGIDVAIDRLNTFRFPAATLVIAAVLTLVVTAQQPAAPQQPAVTFRAMANYVEVDAIVTDAAGNPVKDLTPGDFEVLEDGRLQNLHVCAFVNIPIERPDPLLSRRTIVEPDVVTNVKPVEGRVFVIVLDGYHIAPLRSAEVQRQVRLFIERYLGANDLAAVVHIGNAGAGQEFTSSKRLLLASAARFMGQALHSATQNIVEDAILKQNQAAAIPGQPTMNPGLPEDNEDQERAFMARESLDSMKRLAQSMGALSGRRKAVLFFSEGIDYDTVESTFGSPIAANREDVMANQQGGVFSYNGRVMNPGYATPTATRIAVTDAASVRAGEQEMIAAATRANVSIYAIDPRSLATGTADLASIPPPPIAGEVQAPMNYGGLFVTTSPMQMLSDEFRRAQDSLKLFSDQTGGRAIVDQNDMDGAFRRVVEDNSSYYVLGYQSPDPKRDGRFHRVTVQVKRPDLDVRWRKGYYAVSEEAARNAKPADPVTELLGHPTQVSGLGMRASASVVKGLMIKSTVHLTVEFSGNDVALQEKDGVSTNDIDVEYLAMNAMGRMEANWREVVHLQLLPATRAGFLQQGVRYVTEFQVPPGRYQVRVAARERLGGRAGSVFYDLEVPDFAKPPLSMSDLLLTSVHAARIKTGKSASTVGALLPGPTTTWREFTADDTLSAAASIYDNDTAHAHTVELTATVHADNGAEVFRREEQRESKDLVSATGGYGYLVKVPLAGFAPGRYVLTVDVRSRLADNPVRREIEFRVK